MSRRIQTLERSLDTLFTAPSTSTSRLCTSCRQQRRTFQSSTPAQKSILSRIIGRGGSNKKEAEETQALASTSGNSKKGKKPRVVEKVDPAQEPDYVAATTWRGVERLGGDQWIEQQLDPGEQFVGWGRRTPAKYPEVYLKHMLRHTAIEVFALRDAGRDVLEVCNPRQLEAGSVARTKNVSLLLAKGQGVSLGFENQDQKDIVLRNILSHEEVAEAERLAAEALKKRKGKKAVQKEEVVKTEAVQEPAQTQQAPAATSVDVENDDWLHVYLADPNIKFAISKRMIQLTGLPISDFVLSTSSSLFDLFSALVIARNPAPTKLSERLQISDTISELANVKVAERRITPIDREKEVGRWKIIEKELLDRGLPVTGHTHFSQNLYRRD